MCMNDYSEVQHGIRLILNVFGENDNARRERLVAALDKVAPGGARGGIAAFDEWIKVLPNSTFIGCLSEFDPVDVYGRLSMWRAYSSGMAGVALVMNSYPFQVESDALKAYSVPVAYMSDMEFSRRIDQCLDIIECNLDAVDCLDEASVTLILFRWLVFMAVSMKHPGFHEEEEWRVIYIPSMDESKTIKAAVESIHGIPQVVQKIPLRNDPEAGLDRADLNNLLHQVLIGPSDFPLVLRDAFAAALREKGVENPDDRIAISFIPLRG